MAQIYHVDCQVDSIDAERKAVQEGRPVPQPSETKQKPQGFQKFPAPLEYTKPGQEVYYSLLPPLEQWTDRLRNALVDWAVENVSASNTLVGPRLVVQKGRKLELRCFEEEQGSERLIREDVTAVGPCPDPPYAV